MTTSLISLLLLAAVTAGAADQPAGRPDAAARRAAKSGPDAGPHHRVHTRVVERPGAEGRMVRQESSYTELATGLNVLGPDGQYVPSNPEFEFVQGGVQAVRTAHHLKLPARMGGAFGVEIVTPDGQTVRCHPLAIAAFDPVSGKREFLAVVADAQGWLVDPQTVVYSNCFSGLRASIRFYNGRAGVASDLLLEEIPDLAALGMPEGRLELWTEWEEATLFALKSTKVLHGEADPVRRLRMQAPDLTDQTLGVGAMQLAPGKAFLGGARSRGLAPVADGLPVGKSTFIAEGRRFLVETVDHGKLIRLFGQANVPGLHQAAMGPAGPNVPARPARDARVERRPGVIGPATERIQMAMADPEGAARSRTLATLDWELLTTNLVNFTLRSDTTYWVSGFADLYGTTRIEGGTVVKYDGNDPSSYLLIRGDLVCDTTAWRAAVFTSANDSSVGTPTWTANTPTNYNVGLGVMMDGAQLKHIRVAYAGYGIHSSASVTVSHSQFIHCTRGFLTENGTSTARNVLFYDMDAVFHGMNFDAAGVNLTVDGCAALATAFSTPGGRSIRVTNSIMSRVASLGTESVELDHTAWEDVAEGVFESVGGGAHYLPASSTNRDAGTTAIDPGLLGDLRARTTEAPLWLSGSQTTDIVLGRRAARDTNAPDLGYHYAALDYIAENWTLSPGVTAVLTNGAALGVSFGANEGQGWGVILDDARFFSEGKALAQNHVAPAHVVQEASTGKPWARAFFYDGQPDGLSVNALSQTRFRFTGFSQIADDGYFLYTGAGFQALEWSHCTLAGNLIVGDFTGMSPLVAGMTNCLVERSGLYSWGGYWAATDLSFQNNLFKNSAIGLSSYDNPWLAQDNLFDQSTVSLDTLDITLARSNALYAAEAPAFWDDQVQLSTLVYQAGPLGDSYLSANPQLVDGGSMAADLLGVGDMTTSADGIAEGSSPVDIGLHYATARLVVPGAQAVKQGGTLNIGGVSLELIGGDPEPVQVSLSASNGALRFAATTGLTFVQGSNGAASCTIQGALDAINAALATLSYKGRLDFYGNDELDLTVPGTGIAGKSVPIAVRFNRPPVATDDGYAATRHLGLKVGVGAGLLANDSDPDGDAITATLVGPATSDHLSLKPDGSFEYCGTDLVWGEQFLYAVSDGAMTSQVACVTINLHPESWPVTGFFQFDVVPGPQEIGQTALLTTVEDLLSRCWDADGQQIFFGGITGSSDQGSVFVSDGNVYMSPAINFVCEPIIIAARYTVYKVFCDGSTVNVTDTLLCRYDSGGSHNMLVSVDLESPANGAVLDEYTVLQLSTKITRTVCADPEYGPPSVEYFWGTTSLGVSTDAPSFDLVWGSVSPLACGPGGLSSAPLTAVAMDHYGNFVTSSVAHVTVVCHNDRDGDGISDELEIAHGTDPDDYYNGVLPSIRIAGGNPQVGEVSQPLSQALRVRVTTASGIALNRAPVLFSVSAGGGSFLDPTTSAWVSSIQARADAWGVAQAIFRAPATTGLTSVTAAAQSGTHTRHVSFTILSIESPPDPAPFLDVYTPFE